MLPKLRGRPAAQAAGRARALVLLSQVPAGQQADAKLWSRFRARAARSPERAACPLLP
jgi:hypothetical protein